MPLDGGPEEKEAAAKAKEAAKSRLLTSSLLKARGVNARPDPDGGGTRTWRCIDDSTGVQVFYINEAGSKLKKTPPDFVHEVLNNPERTRKYYSKMRCVRCRETGPPSLVAFRDQCEAFAGNFCNDCMVATTMNIDRVRGCH